MLIDFAKQDRPGIERPPSAGEISLNVFAEHPYKPQIGPFAINALLAAAGYNLRKLLTAFLYALRE